MGNNCRAKVELIEEIDRAGRDSRSLDETGSAGRGDSTVTKSFPPELRRIDASVMAVSSSGLGQLFLERLRGRAVSQQSIDECLDKLCEVRQQPS